MSFLKDIVRTYGHSAMVELKQVGTVTTKLEKLHNNRTFLLKCRRAKMSLITEGIHNITCLTGAALRHTLHKAINFNNRLKNYVLNLEIEIIHGTIPDFEKTLSIFKKKLNSKLAFLIISFL